MSNNQRRKRKSQLQVGAYRMCKADCRVKCSRCVSKCRATYPKGSKGDKATTMTVPYTVYVPAAKRRRKGARFPGRGRVLKTGAVRRKPRKAKVRKTKAKIKRRLGGAGVPRTPAARAALYRRLCRDLNDETTVAELRALASQLEIPGRSKLKLKSQLCRAVAKELSQ